MDAHSSNFPRTNVATRENFVWSASKTGCLELSSMAPGTLFLLPWLIMFTKLVLVGSHLELILTHAAITLPVVIWVLLPYMDALPRELVESAQIDGARQDQILRLVAIPIVSGGMVVAAILSFVFSWNYFIFALVLSDIRTKTAIVASTATGLLSCDAASITVCAMWMIGTFAEAAS